jgi:hypothetical protein
MHASSKERPGTAEPRELQQLEHAPTLSDSAFRVRNETLCMAVTYEEEDEWAALVSAGC